MGEPVTGRRGRRSLLHKLLDLARAQPDNLIDLDGVPRNGRPHIREDVFISVPSSPTLFFTYLPLSCTSETPTIFDELRNLL